MIYSAVLLHASEETVWKLGICRLSVVQDDPELGYAAESIPSMFMDRLAIVNKRMLDAGEIKWVLENRYRNEASVLEKKMTDLRKDRDNLLFSEHDAAVRTEKQDSLKREIEAVKKELEKLNREYSETPVSDSAKTGVRLEHRQPEDGALYELLRSDPDFTAEKADLNLLLYGELRAIGGLYYLELHLWSRAHRRDVEVFRAAAPPEQMYSAAEAAEGLFITAVTGESWATLRVYGEGNALIYIDDEWLGAGSLPEMIIKPGSHTYRFIEPGFREDSGVFNLAEGERRVLSVELERESEKDIVIQSFPPGADVYIDSKWIGRAPVRASYDSLPLSVRTSLEGYRDELRNLDIDDGQVMNITMSPDLYSREAYVKTERRRFYGSFGAAILSIPVTAFAYSLIEQNYNAYLMESSRFSYNEQVLEDLKSRMLLSNAAYICGLGLNISLIFDTIIHAVRYLDGVGILYE